MTLDLVLVGYGADTVLINRAKFVAAEEEHYPANDITVTRLHVGPAEFTLRGVSLAQVADQLRYPGLARLEQQGPP